MRHVSVLSLFSGIGMFDLGVQWALEDAGLRSSVVAQVEIDPFCRRVLSRHWPTVHRDVKDVRDVEKDNTPRADLIIGGFPCQDVSSAGRRAGLQGERSGLWWEYRRAVVELQPECVLVDNVASGMRDWLDSVRCSLEALAYRTRARLISAGDVGAPHRRERVFVLAYRDSERLARTWEEREAGGRAVASDGRGMRWPSWAGPH